MRSARSPHHRNFPGGPGKRRREDSPLSYLDLHGAWLGRGADHHGLPLLSPNFTFPIPRGKRQQDGDTCRRSHRAGRPQGIQSLSQATTSLYRPLRSTNFPIFPSLGTDGRHAVPPALD